MDECMRCGSTAVETIPATLPGFADVRHCDDCGFDQVLPASLVPTPAPSPDEDTQDPS